MKKNNTKIEKTKCFQCNGTGKYEDGDCIGGCCPPFRMKTCYKCNGKGEIITRYNLIKKWEEV